MTKLSNFSKFCENAYKFYFLPTESIYVLYGSHKNTCFYLHSLHGLGYITEIEAELSSLLVYYAA
jgi:hypothetical protein